MKDDGKTLILEITLNLENGAVNVNGPLQNKILCLGMIEVAKRLILDFKVEPKRIVIPEPGIH